MECACPVQCTLCGLSHRPGLLHIFTLHESSSVFVCATVCVQYVCVFTSLQRLLSTTLGTPPLQYSVIGHINESHYVEARGYSTGAVAVVAIVWSCLRHNPTSVYHKLTVNILCYCTTVYVRIYVSAKNTGPRMGLVVVTAIFYIFGEEKCVHVCSWPSQSFTFLSPYMKLYSIFKCHYSAGYNLTTMSHLKGA